MLASSIKITLTEKGNIPHGRQEDGRMKGRKERCPILKY